MVKNAQVAKYKAGKKALGYRMYRAKNADPGFTPMPPVQAPVAVGQSFTHQDLKQSRVVKTEQSFSITNKTKDVQPISMPLHPMNNGMFASLPKIASQYQYFKFNKISLTYTPQVGSSTLGTLAMAAVSSSASAQQVDSYGKLVGITHAYTGNMWTPFTFNVELADLNKQFGLQGCTIADWESIDPADATYIPGYLAFGVNGTADALDTTVNGTITISYNVTLYKPQVDGDVDSAGVCVSGPAFAATTNWFAAIKTIWAAETHYRHENMPWTLGGADGANLLITFNTMRPTLIQFHGFREGADQNPVLNGATATGGVYTACRAYAGTRSYSLIATFKPYRIGATLLLTAGAQQITNAALSLFHVRSKHMNSFDDLN